MSGEPILEEHKAAYRRIIAAVAAGDRHALDAVVAGDVVDHNPIPEQVPGLAGIKQWMAPVRQSFPDLQGAIEQVVAEGDLVAGRVTWQGTQLGQFLEITPTGRPATIEAHHVIHFAGGGGGGVVGHRRPRRGTHAARRGLV